MNELEQAKIKILGRVTARGFYGTIPVAVELALKEGIKIGEKQEAELQAMLINDLVKNQINERRQAVLEGRKQVAEEIVEDIDLVIADWKMFIVDNKVKIPSVRYHWIQIIINDLEKIKQKHLKEGGKE